MVCFREVRGVAGGEVGVVEDRLVDDPLRFAAGWGVTAPRSL